MKITNKKYKEIISKWNPEMVVHIKYTTEYSTGEIICSLAFYMETSSKWNKLLKGVTINDIYISNDETGVVLIHLNDLFNLWLYGLGR